SSRRNCGSWFRSAKAFALLLLRSRRAPSTLKEREAFRRAPSLWRLLSAGEDLRAVRQCDVRGVRELLAVLGGKPLDLDDRADLHRALLPAAAEQRTGRPHL